MSHKTETFKVSYWIRILSDKENCKYSHTNKLRHMMQESYVSFRFLYLYKNKMISYKDFIDLMEKRGYTFKNNNPIMIDESSPNIKTFSVKKGLVGKILEFQCPESTIISSCGKINVENQKEDYYSISIKCFNDEGKEPFQEFHQCIVLTHVRHTVADIIVTKILQKEVNRNDPDVRQLLIYTDPILRFIGSENSCEYPIWSGNYKTFHKDFLKDSFNLYGNEKMIFYVTKPDTDITKVKFEMKADIFEIENEELIILDKNKIMDTTYLDYKSVAKAKAI